MSSQTTLRVAAQFCGPPASGNGGYTAGLLAEHVLAVEQPVRVTLRRPPPLEVDLRVQGLPTDAPGAPSASVTLMHGDTLVAEARPAAFEFELPRAVDHLVAQCAEAAYAKMPAHPFPTCFVCGPDRAVGDGMRLRPGSVADGVTACIWLPGAAAARSGDDHVAPEYCWAALDCPSGWTSDLQARPMVLGQITAQVLSLPRIDGGVVVVGQLQRTQGRKTWTASAAYVGGALVGRAEQLWIAIEPTEFG